MKFSVYRQREGIWELVAERLPFDVARRKAVNLGGELFWKNGVVVVQQPSSFAVLPREIDIHHLVHMKQALEQSGLWQSTVLSPEEVDGNRELRRSYVLGIIKGCEVAGREFRMAPLYLLMYCGLEEKELLTIMAERPDLNNIPGG